MGITDSIMAATVNITGNNQPQSRRSVGLAILAAVVGGGLIAAALPRVAADILYQNSRAVAEDVNAGRPVDMDRLSRAAEQARRVLAWDARDDVAADLGLILLWQDYKATDPQDKNRLLHQSLDAFRQSVALAPGQPIIWFRLSRLYGRMGNMTAAIHAFRMSMLSGPVVAPTLILPRLRQGVSLADQMDDDTRDMLMRQIRLSWVMDPDGVTQMALEPEYSLWVNQALSQLSSLEADQLAYRQNRTSQ